MAALGGISRPQPFYHKCRGGVHNSKQVEGGQHAGEGVGRCNTEGKGHWQISGIRPLCLLPTPSIFSDWDQNNFWRTLAPSMSLITTLMHLFLKAYFGLWLLVMIPPFTCTSIYTESECAICDKVFVPLQVSDNGHLWYGLKASARCCTPSQLETPADFDHFDSVHRGEIEHVSAC